MKIAIILDSGHNESLLRFTETKLFFDANNQTRNFVDDCMVVYDKNQALATIGKNPQHTYFVIETGMFLTRAFVGKYKNFNGVLWVDPGVESVIVYDADTHIGFNKRCKYAPGSKHLYIVENMLKSILAAKKTVYVENTESGFCTVDYTGVRHLYGLASGWKTACLAYQIGLDKLETVTVYDANPHQLEWAKRLHSHSTLPAQVDLPYHHVGDYRPPEWTTTWWSQWNQYPVEFKLLDLLSAPKFPEHSLIWISNVFRFEPAIFNLGWERLKRHKQDLINANNQSIII